MFGWESDEVSKNVFDIEIGDLEDCLEMNEKLFFKGNEESDLSVEENRIEVVEELFDVSDVVMFSQVDLL